MEARLLEMSIEGVISMAELRTVLEEELAFQNGVNSALVTTILDHVVIKKCSTKEALHLDIHLKFGGPSGAVFDWQTSFVRFSPPFAEKAKGPAGLSKEINGILPLRQMLLQHGEVGEQGRIVEESGSGGTSPDAGMTFDTQARSIPWRLALDRTHAADLGAGSATGAALLSLIHI